MQPVITTVPNEPIPQPETLLHLERAAFAAKVRIARALLGMSQDQLAQHVGLTQKSIHRIEQGMVEPKLRTVLKIQEFCFERGIRFEDSRDGGFRLAVDGLRFQGDWDRRPVRDIGAAG